MSKLYGWSQQLEKGLESQRQFAETYEIELLDGTGADFKLADGTLAELKRDYRNSKRTGNLFIERYSSAFKKSDGGPWKAKNDGSKYFIYQFDDVMYCYLVDELITFLDLNVTKFKSRRVNNGNYETLGYLVPINAILHLSIDFAKEVENSYK